ncbi:MAG: FRG domain-containing protein [Candidatus Cloacimonetes bacterium]|nr:FRG domain-containing protein [Candidatus Cloacimonadota bacterium]
MDLQKIEERIQGLLLEFLIEQILTKKKYYYLNHDYFENYLGVKFKYCELGEEDVLKINNEASRYFNDDRINFEIKGSSRIEIITTNLNFLFEKGEKGQQSRYDYLKEFILYDLIKSIFDYDTDLIEIQRNNFLSEYFKYCFKKSTDNKNYVNMDHLNKLKVKGFHKLEKQYIGKQDKLNENEKRRWSNKSEIYQDEDLNITDNAKKKKSDLYIRDDFEGKLEFIYPTKNTSKEPLKKVLEFAAESDSKKDSVFYRGQSDSDWPIKTSISRNPNLLLNEHNLFYEILSLKPNDFNKDASDYEKLITMQHFGLPTRLLDLTRNPLISLYFACNYHFNKDGALFIIKENKEKIVNFEDKRIKCLTEMVKKPPDEICNNCSEYDECSKTVEGNVSKRSDILENCYIVKGVARNPRINNQSGDFIFVGINIANKSKDFGTKKIKIEKILIIDKEAKRDLLEDLKLMNIHGGVVYPDLTNMTKYLKIEYSSGDLMDLSEYFPRIPTHYVNEKEPVSKVELRIPTHYVNEKEPVSTEELKFYNRAGGGVDENKSANTELSNNGQIVKTDDKEPLREGDRVNEETSILKSNEDIEKLLNKNGLSPVDIEEFLKLYADEFEIKNSRVYLNRILKNKLRLTFKERKNILDQIDFDGEHAKK